MAVTALGRGEVRVVAVTVEGSMEAGGWPGTLGGQPGGTPGGRTRRGRVLDAGHPTSVGPVGMMGSGGSSGVWRGGFGR
jgi:hypothetical protein